MKKILLWGIFSLFTLFSQSWGQNALRGLKAVESGASATRTLAVQRAVNRALKQNLLSPRSLLRSTFTLKTGEEVGARPPWCNMSASAFVFEENYNGKTYLWGATASHYFFQKPSLESKKLSFPVQFVAQGHPGHNDVTLFPIPSQIQAELRPLKLAKAPAQKGDKLTSAGYFDAGFQVEKNRVVTDLLPTRILTSLVVEDKLAREGACGGPVLNARGEVVGMHVGSSEKYQAGFVIPVEYFYEILQAYHNSGKALRPFYFNGRKMGDININEYILSIDAWEGEELVQTVTPYPQRAYLDYNHLEKVIDVLHADKIVFLIERTPFSILEKDQNIHQFEITYNLKTLHISKRKVF